MARRSRTRRLSSDFSKNLRRLSHPFDPQSIFSTDRIEHMHNLALRLLQEHGIDVLDDEAIDLLSQNGAIVSDQRVRIGPEMVTEALRTAPQRFQMRAANPGRDQDVYPGRLLFSPGGGCPNVSDRINGRRPGDLASYADAVRLMQSFDVIHKLSPAPEPQDIPVHLRHYAMLRTQISLSDKPLTVYARGRAQVEQSFELIREALGVADDDFSGSAWCSTVINTNSPRLLDRPMAQGLMDFARAGQLAIVTPFCLAGAMAPITVAGALVLQHAEALAAITLNQLVRPGAPVLYGGFGSNVDMRSGAPAFGTPEQIQMAIGSGQLARHIGLPWRSAAGTASNANDMQAAQETSMALWGTLQAGATMVFHACGWLEGGLTLGFEKFVADIEMLQTIAHLCQPPAADDDAMGWDALISVDPGGHFFDTQQTMERYRDAFAEPLLADLSNHGTWMASGGQTAEERATALWMQKLADFQPPEGAQDRAERIATMIERMTAGGGAPLIE